MDDKLKCLVNDILFPTRCVFCGRVITNGENLCGDCRRNVKPLGSDACIICGLPEKMCSCGRTSRFYDAFASAYLYENEVRYGILEYKGGYNARAVRFMASEMARRYCEMCAFTADLIVCIPQTVKETRGRGFDQNRELADELSQQLEIPLYDGMIKMYDITPQKRLSNLYKRGNVAGVFDLNSPSEVANKNIILCDDILTSGSTIDECAKMLKLYDADKIFALTFAVRPYKKRVANK